MSSADAWIRAVDGWADKQLSPTLSDLHRAIAFNLFFLIVQNTPVWQVKENDPPNYPKHTGGRAKGSWQVSLETAQASDYDQRLGSQAAGDDAIEKGRTVISSVSGFPKIFISSPLVYMPVLEFGGYPNPPERGTGRTIDGYSTQAPTGMVRMSRNVIIEQIGNIAREVVRRRLGTV